MNQGALHFDALLSVNNFDQGITRIKNGIREASGVAKKEAEQMDSYFRNLGTAIGGYFTAQSLFSFTKELINVRGEFQKTEIAFTTMLGSADKARQLMGQMVTLAAETPFGLEEVSAGAKQLLAFQVPANQVVDVLTRMGNIAAGLGVPLSRINLVYGQVRAKGKLMGDDMRQFTEAGIPMIAELAKHFGVAESAITEMVSAGKVGFKDVEAVLFNLTNEGGMFFELMEKQSASLSGKVANLEDTWDQMLNKIGEGNEGILYSGIEGLTYLIENYEDLAEAIFAIIALVGVYKAAVIATNVISLNYNKTIASEIALLSISEKMKLGRALVTQRQAEATARDTVSELANLKAKYASLQADVSALAIKKQVAIQSGVAATAKAQEARMQLASAKMELSSIQATGTARQIEISQKRVQTAQNTVIATQEAAAIARKKALAVATEFNAAKQQLENTAQAVGIAEKTAATAAETAQIAAKNANAIATTRLTIVQNLQTIATQLNARAQAFLNATILANPYATAAVLLAAMTYAIYRQATALTALEEIQQKFKDELSQTNVGVNEQITKLNSLISVVKKQSTSYDEASKILKQINSLTNNRIQGLTVETIKTGEADAAIKAYTKSLYRQAEVMLKVQEIAKLEEQRKKLEADIADETFMERVSATLNPFDKNYYSGSFQGAKEEELKAIDKTISDYKKDVEKAVKDGLNLSDTTIEAVGPKIKIGILEGLKEELKTAIENIDKATSNADIKKWVAIRDRIQDKIDSYGTKRKKTKEEGQIAEIFPFGSPKQIQQQMQLLQEAMDLVDKGMVKVRKLDKYGKDKDKKGNPFLTGEIISIEEAGKRYDVLSEKLRSTQYKTFQERIDEAERQWNNYYKISEYYGKESADAQYSELFKGAKNYLEYLEKQEQVLRAKQSAGILTEQEKKDILFLQQKITELNGTETPFQNFKRNIDDALKSLPSFVDQLDALENAQSDSYKKEGGNTDFFLQQRKYLEERKREIAQQQKDIYSNFIKEQETFEQKQTQISEKYNDFRKRIGLLNLSDPERLRLLNAAGKDEAKEYRDAFMSVFEKTDLFEKAFGNIDALTKKEISQLIPQLENKMQELIDLGAPTAEVEVFRKKIEDLRTLTSGNSPFKSLIASFKELRKKIREGTATQEDFNRLNQHIQETKFYTDLAINSAKELAEALSLDGKGGPFEKFAKDLTETIEGLVNALVGYLSNNVQQMAGGIAQMVVGVVKLMSTAGDGKIEKNIQDWQRAVEGLKTSYEDLQRVIEKTAGEASITMQRSLINNLKEQQRLLIEMRDKEIQKKKTDQSKLDSYNQQINDINTQISEVIENFKKQITSTEFKDLSQKLADALIDAFGKGEDAAEAFDKVVDDVMRNAVANALKIKILEPAVKSMVDQIYSSMGYGNGSTAAQQAQISALEKELAEVNEQLKKGGIYLNPQLAVKRKELMQKISELKAQIANTNISGSFDGLTKEERDKIKAEGETAMQQYMAALQQYEDLFGTAAGNAQSLKGDIKGITEKTAGALEAQINAMRINLVAVLKIHQTNQKTFQNQLNVLSQIEINTRNLVGIRKDISEMNAKMKKNLAGVP